MLHSAYSITNIYVSFKLTTHGFIKYKKGILVLLSGLTLRIIDMRNEIVRGSLILSRFSGAYVRDKKERLIYNCRFRDKILHTSFNNVLILHFNRYLIKDTFACLLNRGSQRAINKLKRYTYTVKNTYKEPYLLKIDIKKFFYSIDRVLLVEYSKKYFKGKDYWMYLLLKQIILSFNNTTTGLPLGNCLSQLLANVYLNEFDQYLKRVHKIKHYIRYADDIFIFVDGIDKANIVLKQSKTYLKYKLRLDTHDTKSKISNIGDISGLGYRIYKGILYPSSKNKRSLYKFANRGDLIRLASWYGLNYNSNCYSLIYHALLNTNIVFINKKFLYRHSIEYIELKDRYINLLSNGITRDWLNNLLNKQSNYKGDIDRIIRDSEYSKYIKYLNILKDKIIREYNYNKLKVLELLLYTEDYKYINTKSKEFTITNLKRLGVLILDVIVDRLNTYTIEKIDTTKIKTYGTIEDIILYIKRLEVIDKDMGNYYPSNNIVIPNKSNKLSIKDIKKYLKKKENKRFNKRLNKILSFDF